MVLRICIVIPAYNEETVIERNLKTIIEYAQELPQPATVVAVNDGSDDRSGEILMALKKQYPEEVFHAISYAQNRGYGGALKIGTAYAIEKQFDYVIFMDSDLTNHPKYLSAIYEKMGQGCEYIKATRYQAGGGMQGAPLKRRILSKIGNAIGRVLFRLPLSDVTNGFRAVRVDILKKLNLRENGFPIILEELFQAKQYVKSFSEVPYILTEREGGGGATHFQYTCATITKYLYYAFKGFFTTRSK